MKCICGGELERDITGALRTAEKYFEITKPAPPRHRKKRLRKKLMKKYDERITIMKMGLAMLVPMVTTSAGYKCKSCGRTEGMYSALGRNLIQVEPLPPGALPIYDKE